MDLLSPFEFNNPKKIAEGVCCLFFSFLGPGGWGQMSIYKVNLCMVNWCVFFFLGGCPVYQNPNPLHQAIRSKESKRSQASIPHNLPSRKRTFSTMEKSPSKMIGDTTNLIFTHSFCFRIFSQKFVIQSFVPLVFWGD